MSYRMGIGYDVHAFIPAQTIRLCNIEIPSPYGLKGHSDADAPIHALCDALLGALALGDIGQHYPDTDAKYEGIDSSVLLKDVYGKVKSLGYTLCNCDLIIIAQQPKIAPYAESMRIRLAELLETHIDNINIKATTTEKLGFIGREEGLAAQAIVCLRKGMN